MTRHASIDIGTNSTRLLVADVVDQKIETLFYAERLTKLGSGLQPDGHVSEDAQTRVLDVLTEFQEKLRDFQVHQVQVFATSATRDAQNRTLFLEKIKQRTGWECRVLSGEEEAKLSFLGVISDLQVSGDYVVCDVGGGSSECIFARNSEMQRVASLNIGSNRMTRQFLLSDPPTREQIKATREFIRESLSDFELGSAKIEQIVAVGGTASTLALMDARSSIKTPYQAHFYKLQYDGLENWINELSRKTVKERQSIIGLNPQRADVILGGALIFAEILTYMQQTSMIVSLRDLLFGIFLEKDDDGNSRETL